ncbi:MAG: methyltransferase domain-containing protein [Bacteroidota bacterium]|nr:methyltransferase domain-containing protein [Bacteroidota bacterium]
MPRWFLSERAVDLDEIMDDPDCDPVLLTNTYDWFARLNPWLGRWHAVYRSHIRRHLRPDRATRILDIGCGAGDILRLIRDRAGKDGFEVDLLGIDPDPRAIVRARALGTNASLSFQACHSSKLVETGATFDLVISNHLLHHLSRDDVQGLLADSMALSDGLVIHNDICRDDIAWLAFWPVGAIPSFNSFILSDGLRSIRRAWHPDELKKFVPASWEIQEKAPFRTLLIHRAAS